jgi:hypothetical protein
VEEFNNHGVHTSVRRRTIDQESGVDLFILERTDMGITPAQLMRVVRHVVNYTKANKNLKRCDVIGELDIKDGNPPIETFATYIKSPAAFVAPRIFIDSKYIWS